MFWLKCSGRDCGHVYMHDHKGRFGWRDELFYRQFANLGPPIKDYLGMRKRGELPQSPKATSTSTGAPQPSRNSSIG